uniref:RRM domain-containing protein n=1 Tax=Setaria digitata TaxID=48799 RepID=A0A915PHP2_9BILA
MNTTAGTVIDVDLDVISGNSGGTNALAHVDGYDIFGNDSFGGYATIVQMKNIWSVGGNDSQVAAPDIVPRDFPGTGVFSRKVFIGGLPPDLTAETISLFFEQFGTNKVDWPHRKCTGGDIPPNGYAFVVFTSGRSVEYLVSRCICKQGKLNILLKNGDKDIKVVQVRPWVLSDQIYCATEEPPQSNRYSVFIGGVPRTTTACKSFDLFKTFVDLVPNEIDFSAELAMLLQQTIGNVVYVSLEVDADTKYPKGAAQVVFDTRESYLTAIAMRLITLSTIDQVKEIEIKPYLMDSVQCEMCNLAGARHLCPELCCLMYLCEPCWTEVHKRRGLLHHRPMTKAKPGSPLRNISNRVTAFPFFNSSLDHLNHRVREALPLHQLLQHFILQTNISPPHPAFI